MQKTNPNEPAAKGGVAILCFLIVIVGQIYLLRNQLFTSFASLPFSYYIEMLFWVILIIGIVVCWIRPKGWESNLGCGIALGLFLIYMIFSILTYQTFLTGYLTGFNPTFSSGAGAIVGAKLVITLIGVTAGIPVGPRIDDHEYARRLREKVEQQNAQWAMASVKGAQKDLDNTLSKLKETLSPEDLQKLLAQLQQDLAVSSAETETDPKESAAKAEEERLNKVAEDWKGWGQGM